jgi:hypothetical protein
MTLKEMARGICPPLTWNAMKRLRRHAEANDPQWQQVHGTKLFLPPSHALPTIVAQCPFYDTALPQFLRFLHTSTRKKLTIVDVVGKHRRYCRAHRSDAWRLELSLYLHRGRSRISSVSKN